MQIAAIMHLSVNSDNIFLIVHIGKFSRMYAMGRGEGSDYCSTHTSAQRLLPVFIGIATVLLVIVIILSATIVHLTTSLQNSPNVVAIAKPTTVATSLPVGTTPVLMIPTVAPITPTPIAPTPTTPSTTVGSTLCQADAAHGWTRLKLKETKSRFY